MTIGKVAQLNTSIECAEIECADWLCSQAQAHLQAWADSHQFNNFDTRHEYWSRCGNQILP